MFGFQRLDVYRTAIVFLSTSARLLHRVPRGHRDLKDQLRRAALSIPLNIAEGSGRLNRDAGQFYVVARGSALECAAILDAMEALELIEGSTLYEPRQSLVRVVSVDALRLGQASSRSAAVDYDQVYDYDHDPRRFALHAAIATPPGSRSKPGDPAGSES